MNKIEIKVAIHYLKNLMVYCENTNDIQLIYDEIYDNIKELEKRSEQLVSNNESSGN